MREAKSLTAADALKARVIDVVASGVPDLLAQIDGREVKTATGTVRLQTRGAVVETLAPDWRTEFLSVVSNPTVALILLLVGVYGLFIEFTHPGVVVPGVVGSIALLLAFFAFQLLPVNYAGLGLILLGIALMVAEAFVPSFGALGIGGIAAFVLGGVLLFDRDVPGLSIPLGLLVGIGIASGIAVVLTLGAALSMDYVLSSSLQGTWRDAAVKDVTKMFGPACGQNWFAVTLVLVVVMGFLAGFGAVLGVIVCVIMNRFFKMLLK